VDGFCRYGVRSLRGRMHQTGSKRRAATPERTHPAARPSREAHRCSEIDETECNSTWMASRSHALEQRPELSVVTRPGSSRPNTEAPIEESNHVRIEEGTRPVECDNKNRIRDVTADAWQRAQLFLLIGNGTSELSDQRPPRLQEAPASVQKPKGSQQLNELRRLGSRQRLRIRIRRDELGVDPRNQIRPRALEQQLGDEYLVRIPSAAPRKRAPVHVKPRTHAPTQPRDIFRVDAKPVGFCSCRHLDSFAPAGIAVLEPRRRRCG
jgi:hypothetical protein